MNTRFLITPILALSVSAALLPAMTLAKGRPTGGETTTNLSYPALFYGTSLQTGVIGTFSLGASYPDGMSFGCLKPETIGTTTYPNTSCVNDSATVVTPITAEACAGAGGKCEGYSLERIYWQKNSLNKWQAGYGSQTEALPVDYLDWGDNLEGRTWPVQVLRVETNTFATLDTPTLRFDMWHVFGQGTNELWGVHTTNADPAIPYVFVDWPYAVNNSALARLNIAKLANGPATCPTTATGYSQSPFTPIWNLANRMWSDTWVLYDADYTAELNIKGSYVYGYNWNLRSAVVPGDVNKAGWWRLTFYSPDDSVDFSTWMPPTETNNTLAPPSLIVAPVPIVTTLAPTAAEEGESGLLLYVPQVDQANNLTYLDICISASKGGGGGGGGKPR